MVFLKKIVFFNIMGELLSVNDLDPEYFERSTVISRLAPWNPRLH